MNDLQTVEAEMLSEFIAVCNKLGLRYFLLYGTMLGAVRHKGFIPWDDDIDAGLFRTEYEVFIREAQALLPDRFFLQTNETDEGYYRNFAKIRNNETTFIEKGNKKGNFNQGVYIDIFPIDYYPDKWMTRRLLRIRKDLYMAKISEIFNDEDLKESPGKHAARRIVQKLMPSVRYAANKRENLFRSVTKGQYVIIHEGAYGEREIVPKAWFGEGISAEFEGQSVRIPREYDRYLKHLYGDYMELPPEEKQVSNHDPKIIDLTKSYRDYL